MLRNSSGDSKTAVYAFVENPIGNSQTSPEVTADVSDRDALMT